MASTLYCKIPTDLHAEICTQANANDVTMTAFVIRALDYYLRKEFEWEGTAAVNLP